MKNENDLTFSFFIFQVLRKINWHSGTRIVNASLLVNLHLQLLRIAVGLLVESCLIIVFDLLEFVHEVNISS